MEKYIPGTETEISFLAQEKPSEFEQMESYGTIQEYSGFRDKTFWERIGVGGSITAKPIVHNDTIFFGACDKNFYAVSLAGKELWRFGTGGTIQSYAAAEGNRVYFGSGDRNLYCLDTGTGKLVWRFQSDGHVGGSPVLHKGRVYFGSSDGNLYVLDAATGKMIWVFRTSQPLITPLIEDDNIFVGYNGGSLYCLGLNGELRWRFNANAWISAWPAASDEDSIYFGSGDRNLYSLKRNGYLKWRYTTKDIVLCPVIKDGKIYVGSGDNRLYCISSEGKRLWDYQAEDSVGHVTVSGDTAYFGSYDNHMYAVDKDTGRLLWRFKTNGFVHTNPTVYRDFVVLGCWDCNLYVLDKEGRLKWRFMTSMSAPSKVEPPEETTTKRFELVMKSATKKEEVKRYKAENVLGNYEANVTDYASGMSKTYLSSKKRGYIGDTGKY